uniref:EB1 C-terminal domain-containing protein n=1 Tax=Ditylenchus dipsaci TaxID=166011 RepID=A0A915DF88_9BILA
MTNPKEKIKAGGAAAGKSLRAPQPKATPASRPAASVPQRTSSTNSVNSSGKASAASTHRPQPASAKPAVVTSRPAPLKQSAPAGTRVAAAPAPAPPPANDSHLFEELKQLKAELEECRLQLGQSDELVAGLEKERDFYFTKLRKIEVICQDHEPAGVVEVPKLLEVLYETEDGFAPPEEVEEAGLNGDGNGEEY